MTWIIYDDTTFAILKYFPTEPTVLTGQGKAFVNHTFYEGQLLLNWKYDEPTNTVIQKPAEEIYEQEEPSEYQAIIQSKLGLINQRTIFEPFFIRESIPNVTTGVWFWTVPKGGGDYILEHYIRYSYNSTQNDFLAHILIDDSSYSFPLHIEPKDVGGSGEILPTVVNGTVSGVANSGTNQWLLASGKELMGDLLEGDVKTFKLEFACESFNNEATIYEAFVGIKKVTNANQL